MKERNPKGQFVAGHIGYRGQLGVKLSNKHKLKISKKTKLAMARTDVQKKLHKKREPLSDERKAKQSDKLIGKEPKNLWTHFSRKNKYAAKHGWFETGEKRYFMKSIWERNYARYLQWLKENNYIQDWQYEPRIFIFEKIKFGNRTYKPDFLVIENNGVKIWHEVKGWMNDSSRVKLSRMAKYFPDEKIIIIDKQQYYELKHQVKRLISDWETDLNVWRDWKPKRI